MVSCVTLLSDFGTRDTSVAVVKGLLMQHCPAPIADISHEVTPFLISEAAYLLASVYKNFPKDTVHLVLCDTFAQPDVRLILSEKDGHYFVSADNGIVATALGMSPTSWLVSAHQPIGGFTEWLAAVCNLIGRLQNATAAQLALPSCALSLTPGSESISRRDALECDVIHIDHYENVVLNITRSQFEAARQGRSFRLQFAVVEEIEELSKSYHDVREGYKLCRFNNNDHMEICINRGNAASLFGLRMSSKHNQIKIVFE